MTNNNQNIKNQRAYRSMSKATGSVERLYDLNII
jgi:hypothetical protein